MQLVGNNAVVRHLWVSESELDGKVTNTKIGVMQVWQKQDGGWKLLARASWRLPRRHSTMPVGSSRPAAADQVGRNASHSFSAGLLKSGNPDRRGAPLARHEFSMISASSAAKSRVKSNSGVTTPALSQSMLATLNKPSRPVETV
jgi:hypothetical protein